MPDTHSMEQMAQAIIALGSNLEPRHHLRLAVQRFTERLTLTAVSAVYRTPPWGYTDQPYFLNAVVSVEAELCPRELLNWMLEIELELGRERPFPNAPRTLDLDLIDYDRLISDDPLLTLPHPRLQERAFVLLPLYDLAPDWRHPRLGKTSTELLDLVDQAGITRDSLVLETNR